MFFSLLSFWLMRRETAGISALWQRTGVCRRATWCSYPHAQQQRKEQRRRLEWIPNELQEFSNVLMFPYDQIWIYSAFCPLKKSLADCVTGAIPMIFCFLRGIRL